jgi:hypothetical protein
MRPAYYNELDSYAAQWLRNLIKAGHIPAGDVDDRSIKDVAASDLDGYGQCHWFAGIGGGALACRLAGWSDDREIWTGGPPCQDNSNAAAIHGGRTGLRGERSGLALTWLDLVGERLPATVIFENVPGISLIFAGECSLLPTVTARDWKNPGRPDHPRLEASRGEPLPETLGARIDPGLACWMMGYPPGWLECAPASSTGSATPGCRKRQPKSSKP